MQLLSESFVSGSVTGYNSKAQKRIKFSELQIPLEDAAYFPKGVQLSRK